MQAVKDATTMESLGLMVGTVVGAGVLGLPFAFARSGFAVGAVHLIVVTLFLLGVHYAMMRVAMHAGEDLQFAGLVGKFLGHRARFFAALMYIFVNYGALTAYLIGEGEVLSVLFGGAPMMWSIIFLCIFAPLVWRGIKSIERIELVLSLGVFTVITGIIVFLAPHANSAALSTLNVDELFSPFGVVFFAVYGVSAVPAIVAGARHSPRSVSRAVCWGTLIPAILYLLFAGAVVAVTGNATTEVASIGLGRVVGPFMVLLGNAFAVLAMSTSFLGISLVQKQVFAWDLQLPHWVAAVLTLAVPLIIFFVSGRSFIHTIEFVGSFLLPIICVVVVIMYIKVRRMPR